MVYYYSYSLNPCFVFILMYFYDIAAARLLKLASRQWNRHDVNSKCLSCLAVELDHGPPSSCWIHRFLCLQKPIIPVDIYRAVRDSQLIGLSGYSREVHTKVLLVLKTYRVKLEHAIEILKTRENEWKRSSRKLDVISMNVESLY